MGKGMRGSGVAVSGGGVAMESQQTRCKGIARVAVMRRERTEALKAKRRVYGDAGGHLHFNEQVYVPRPDEVSNAVTTFEKDNYVYIEYE